MGTHVNIVFTRSAGDDAVELTLVRIVISKSSCSLSIPQLPDGTKAVVSDDALLLQLLTTLKALSRLANET